MPLGDVVVNSSLILGVPDKMQFQSDERDGFNSWLRAEFAAANAIIDSLCHHLRCVGDPGEYDMVISCIQQRRFNWTPVLLMQQFFPIADVLYALQQVTWRKQQRHYDQVPRANLHIMGIKKAAQRSGGNRQGNKVQDLGSDVENVRDNRESEMESHTVGLDLDSSVKLTKLGSENLLGSDPSKSVDGLIVQSGKAEQEEEIKHGGKVERFEANGSVSMEETEGPCKNALPKVDADNTLKQVWEQKIIPARKTFVATEILDGKAVNVVEGLELYEEIFDGSEISRLVLLVNELRAAGRRGQLQGQTFIVSKRPMKGHGREMIQMGGPVTGGRPEDESTPGSSRDRKVEAIPSQLQDVIDRLVHFQLMNMRPDSCIIDFFNEGDHSQPQTCPPWFGRPFCRLLLTECDVIFGRVIGLDHPGHYRGSLKLSLAPGSMLVMQGKSADFAKHAISSLRKQRIIVTFTQPQPKNSVLFIPPVLTPSVRSPSLGWYHQAGPKLYRPVSSTGVSSTGVLPAPPIQPLFVPASVVPLIPVPLPPATAGWPTIPRQAPPRMLLPGTGVFLPPSDSPGNLQPVGVAGDASFGADTSGSPGNAAANELPERSTEILNASHSNDKENGLVSQGMSQDCNGDGNKVVVVKEELRSVRKKVPGKTSH